MQFRLETLRKYYTKEVKERLEIYGFKFNLVEEIPIQIKDKMAYWKVDDDSRVDVIFHDIESLEAFYKRLDVKSANMLIDFEFKTILICNGGDR